MQHAEAAPQREIEDLQPGEGLPPRRPFRYVLESTVRLSRGRSRMLAGLNREPARRTSLIHLGGSSRHLLFVDHRSSAQRATRLGYRDVTDEFHREWERDPTGAWRRYRIEAPPPITAPEEPPPDPDDPLDLPVKRLSKAVTTGLLDDRLEELLDREKAQKNSAGRTRDGAVALFVARIAHLAQQAPPATPPEADGADKGGAA